MTAFLSLFTFEFFTGIRCKSQLFMNYLFPLGFYLMVGSFMNSINPFLNDVMIPAMAVFAVLTATVLSLPNPLVEAREGGVLRSYRINGIPSAAILAIPALTTGLHLIPVTLIITLSAPYLFGAPLPAYPVNFALCLLAFYFACSGLSLLIGVISANTQVTVLWSQLIFLPSMLIGGLMVPSEMLPAGFQKMGQLFPATHAMQALRGFAMGYETKASPQWSLLVLLAGGIVAFTLAAFLFSWDSKNTELRRHPLLAVLALAPYALAIILAS
jgi:ABC-2 type transport system permease protein